MAVFRFSKIFISYEQVDRFALAKYKFRKKEWQGSSAGTGLECVLVSPENELLGTHWRLQPNTSLLGSEPEQGIGAVFKCSLSPATC